MIGGLGEEIYWLWLIKAETDRQEIGGRFFLQRGGFCLDLDEGCREIYIVIGRTDKLISFL